MTMKKPIVITVPILPFGMVNSHIIIGERGCIVVDTGIPGSEHKIEQALKNNGLGLRSVNLIVITHAHTDHAGSAARLRELTGAPILAHEGDLDHYERRKPMTYCATSLFARFFLRTGVPTEPYTAFTPDILLADDDIVDLHEYGVAGSVKPTPGHTAGSISIQLEMGEALVGDLVASGILLGGMIFKGRAIRPPFEDDPHTVSVELMKMVDAGVQKFHMGHGGPLPAKEVHRHAVSLLQLKPGRKYGLQAVGCACTDRRASGG